MMYDCIRIEEIGFDQVIDETAYTWFNRFIAFRFMEVNNYLPTRVRVLSSEYDESAKPYILAESIGSLLKIEKGIISFLKERHKEIENNPSDDLLLSTY